MNADAVGMAMRVLGTAVLRGVVVNRPAGVVVYSRELEMQELRWLIGGMDATQTTMLPLPGPGGEEIEVAGTILGRVYRLHISRVRHAELTAASSPAGAR
jgi:hypothetical protein